jgi:hypothetical protein
MKRVFLFTGLVTIVALLAIGCSSDDDTTGPGNGTPGPNTTVRDDSGNYWVTRIDATSEEEYTYYSFVRKDTVDLTAAQAEESTEWDVAFMRSIVITNSGTSGTGDVLSVDLMMIGDATEFADVTSANADAVQQNQWQSDGQNLVIDNYYVYNTQTHQLDMTRIVYAMRDAEGRYMKVQFTEIYGGGAPPAMGNYVVKYVHNPSGTDLSGTGVSDTVDGSAGIFYYDFSAGMATAPADPQNSLDWDIKVSSYDVFLNSSFSGIGDAAANPAYWLIDMADSSDFDAYSEAISVPQAYFQDQEGSVFTDWYDYDGATHTLSSKGHVYLVMVGGSTYKLEIETWYGDTGESANFIFHWEQL